MAELHPAACFRGEDGRQGRSPAFLCVQPLCPVSCSRSVKGCTPTLLCVQPDALSSLFFYIHFSFLSFSLLFLFSPVLFLFYSLFYALFLPAFFSFLLFFISFFFQLSFPSFSFLYPFLSVFLLSHFLFSLVFLSVRRPSCVRVAVVA